VSWRVEKEHIIVLGWCFKDFLVEKDQAWFGAGSIGAGKAPAVLPTLRIRTGKGVEPTLVFIWGFLALIVPLQHLDEHFWRETVAARNVLHAGDLKGKIWFQCRVYLIYNYVTMLNIRHLQFPTNYHIKYAYFPLKRLA